MQRTLISFTSLICCALLVALVASAKGSEALSPREANAFWANYFAVQSAQFKGARTPKISLHATDVKFAFEKTTVDVDFKDFNSNRLYLNNSPIQLRAYKTRLNYRMEIETALAHTKTTALYLLVGGSRAEAITNQEISDYVARLFKSAADTSAKVNDLYSGGVPTAHLETFLIRAYVSSVKEAQENNANDKDGFDQAIPRISFLCKDQQLLDLTVRRIPVSPNPGTEEADELKRALDGTWSTRVDGQTEARQIKDAKTGELRWVRSYDGSGAQMLDPSKDAPFMDLPEILNRCCAKASCADKVMSAFRAVDKRAGAPHAAQTAD